MHSRCILTPLQPQSSQPRRTRRRNSHAEAHLGLLDSETISWLVNYGKQSDRCSALGAFVAPICLIYLQRFRFHPVGMGVAVAGGSGWSVSLQLLSLEHSKRFCFLVDCCHTNISKYKKFSFLWYKEPGFLVPVVA